MFDIGFFEMCLIAIIALIVIGPEKLPRVARKTGLWLGKMKGMVKTVQYEIDEQIRVDELKQSLKKTIQPISSALDKSEQDLKQAQTDITNKANVIGDSLQGASKDDSPKQAK